MTTPNEITRSNAWKAVNEAVDEYIDGYEFRGEPGDHIPTEFERFLITDAIVGLLSDEKILPLIAAAAPVAQEPVYLLAEEEGPGQWLETNEATFNWWVKQGTRATRKLYAAPVAAQAQPAAGLDVGAVLRRFLTGDGFIAECDIPHIVADLTAQPAINGYTCAVPDDCETLHWRGQILSMNELASVAQPAVGEEIHVHIEGRDVLTLPLASSGMNAPRFVVHVPAQADHFRDATKMVPSDEDILGCAGVSRLHGDTPAMFGTADIVRFAHCVLKHFARPQPSGNAVHDDAMERALTELVDKIVPGLDSGDILADASTAGAALDRTQASGNSGELPKVGLPPRPAPEAPANTVGIGWHAYTAVQMLSYGRTCADAQREADRAALAAQASGLQQDVEALLIMLGNREYAEHWAKTEIGQRLEAAMTAIHGELSIDRNGGQDRDTDLAFEAVRKQLCKLPRHSFIHSDGAVRSVRDSAGNWLEFDKVHALFDPITVDAAREAANGQS